MINEETILLWYGENHPKNVSIKKYREWVIARDKKAIAGFIINRYCKRFIDPFQHLDTKNGFAMMACGCLLIETLQCFRKGKPDSKSNTENIFINFFKESKTRLSLLKHIPFYRDIRCGILHQGETKGGFKLTRTGNLLYNENTKAINATIFLAELKIEIERYGNELENSLDNDPIWINFLKKMESVTVNCDYDARAFQNGFAAVCINGLWGFIDLADNMLVKPKYCEVSDFKAGYAICKLKKPNDEDSDKYPAYKADCKLEILDNQGNTYFTDWYDSITPIPENPKFFKATKTELYERDYIDYFSKNYGSVYIEEVIKKYLLNLNTNKVIEGVSKIHGEYYLFKNHEIKNKDGETIFREDLHVVDFNLLTEVNSVMIQSKRTDWDIDEWKEFEQGGMGDEYHANEYMQWHLYNLNNEHLFSWKER